jgi:hypothetical protein
MSILATRDGLPRWAEAMFAHGQQFVKHAGDPTVAYNLAGVLQLSSTTGYLLLSVPNTLVRGVFSAMREPGIELPTGPAGDFMAHITVMRPEEIEQIGGADKITERGKQYHYTLGRLMELEPETPGIAKVWYIRVHSPELQALRQSYGLSSLPSRGQFDFHITTAVRRRGVLGKNETSKET